MKNVLIITKEGRGKLTSLKEYRFQSRGAAGIVAMKITGETGQIVSALVVEPEADVIIISKNGKSVRMSVSDFRVSGRNTTGVRAIRLADDDFVATVCVV